MRAWKDVATLVKEKGSKGRFAACHAANLPLLLEKGMTVVFVPPRTDTPRSAVVEEVYALNDTRFELSFTGLTQDEVRRLVGCHCLVKRSDIDFDFDSNAQPSLVGWTVLKSADTVIGEVVAVVDNTAQSLLEVKRADTENTVLIPLVDEFVTCFDAEQKTVTMNLPDGLLEL